MNYEVNPEVLKLWREQYEKLTPEQKAFIEYAADRLLEEVRLTEQGCARPGCGLPEHHANHSYYKFHEFQLPKEEVKKAEQGWQTVGYTPDGTKVQFKPSNPPPALPQRIWGKSEVRK